MPADPWYIIGTAKRSTSELHAPNLAVILPGPVVAIHNLNNRPPE